MYVISRQLLHRSARPSSISQKIGIMKGFSKKQTYLLYILKSLLQKKPQGYQLFDFPRFFIILSLITQRVFIAETSAWVFWQGILFSIIQKIKNQQQQFFSKKKLVSMTCSGITQN
jgi:hypothetical protein